MKKIAMFAFNGEPMCFVHVLLNALDLKAKGHEVALIVEGSSVRLVEMLREGKGLEKLASENPQMYRLVSDLFKQAVEAGIIDCFCQACSHQLGVLESVKALALPLGNGLHGHPAMSDYVEKGYEIISF